MVGRALLLRLAASPRVERFVRRNHTSGALARRFVAGDTMEDVVEPVRALNALGITATLDYLGEHVHSAETAREYVAYYHRLLDFIAAQHLDTNISLKLTQLGLDISDAEAETNLRSILEHAGRRDQFIRVDMEGSEYTERTLRLMCRAFADHKNTGTVIQSYLRRSPADIEELIGLGMRVRLVKGAYMEPPEVAYQRKAEVDRSFDALAERLLSDGVYPAIATHDERRIRHAIAVATAREIGAERFEFQMLYGIRRDLQTGLVRRGYRMRTYIPFGTEWYGYLMRRLAERPANLWFIVKNILRR